MFASCSFTVRLTIVDDFDLRDKVNRVPSKNAQTPHVGAAWPQISTPRAKKQLYDMRCGHVFLVVYGPFRSR